MEPPVCDDKTTDECLLPCFAIYLRALTYCLSMLYRVENVPRQIQRHFDDCECASVFVARIKTLRYDDNCFSILCHVRPLVKFLFFLFEKSQVRQQNGRRFDGNFNCVVENGGVSCVFMLDGRYRSMYSSALFYDIILNHSSIFFPSQNKMCLLNSLGAKRRSSLTKNMSCLH